MASHLSKYSSRTGTSCTSALSEANKAQLEVHENPPPASGLSRRTSNAGYTTQVYPVEGSRVSRRPSVSGSRAPTVRPPPSESRASRREMPMAYVTRGSEMQISRDDRASRAGSTVSSSTVRPSDSASNVSSPRDFPRSEMSRRPSVSRSQTAPSRAPSTSSRKTSNSRALVPFSESTREREMQTRDLPSLSELGRALGGLSSTHDNTRMRVVEVTTVTHVRETEVEMETSSSHGSSNRRRPSRSYTRRPSLDSDLYSDYSLRSLSDLDIDSRLSRGSRPF